MITSEEILRFRGRTLVHTLANIEPAFRVLPDNYAGSDPNSVPEVQVRGISNLPVGMGDYEQERSRNNTPLILLDGLEISLEQMMDLNQYRVAGITLLKDAVATALYGSRSAHGVILITTGQTTDPAFHATYRGELSLEFADLSAYDLLHAGEKLEMERRAGYYESSDPDINNRLSALYASRQSLVAQGVDTDWLSKPLRTSHPHSHSLLLEGGFSRFRFAAGLNYVRHNGVMKKSYREIFEGDLSVGYQGAGLSLTLQLSLGDINAIRSPYGSLQEYATTAPYFSPTDENGDFYRFFPSDPAFIVSSPVNPLYNAALPGKDKSDYYYRKGALRAEWNLSPAWSLSGRFGFEKIRSRSDRYLSVHHTAFAGAELHDRGLYEFGRGSLTAYRADITARYHHIWAERHTLRAALFTGIAGDRSWSGLIRVVGFTNDNMSGSALGTSYGTSGSWVCTNHQLAFAASACYDYDSRYTAEVVLRTDRHSAFIDSDQWETFGAVGVGWNIHRESFLLPSEAIDRLRIRASYGKTGSQGLSPFDAMMRYRDAFLYGLTAYANPGSNVAVPVVDKVNLGIEGAFFDRVLEITADIYREKSPDLTTIVNTPGGYYETELGDMENTGWEVRGAFRIGGRDRQRPFGSLALSLGGNRNKLTNLNPLFGSYNTGGVYTLYAVKSLGIDPATGREIYLDKQGQPTTEWNSADLVDCGSSEPKLSGNLNGSFHYRGLTLAASCGYRLGASVYNSTLADATARATTRFIEKEKLFTIQSLNATYDFGQACSRKLKLSGLSLGISATDLLYVSSVERERGIRYPFARRVTLSLNASF